ncbi:hypothetical protein BT96DRAFT_940008 [Gymnopus androsaceus JB14]|uniref:Uncharacterized protein n=1 Tax=Gymnopus androsaceus JB14 TaxID=1447944 RepID=A0A6A4HNJ0_9AGAR|nr:hypothetical protein BT96DRAFT_940008 [Gymnopus androsaceus JB14]
MAVLAPSDWQYLSRENQQMDFPSNNPSRTQRNLPANDSNSSPPPPANHPQFQQMNHQQAQQPPQQQPYPYPVQQQPQGSWTPSISAQPFYPSFYQNHQQSTQPYPQLPQQAPYFDPANAQLAQWAYQQMMFNAQQGFMPPPQPTRTGSGRSGAAPSPDYFTQNQINPMFNPFPSGTPPPPHPNRSPSVDQQQQQNGQYPGFHPYRRPVRQGSSHQEGDWRSANAPSPPYARPDASGSSSSVNSTHSQRQRTNSNQSGHSGHNTPPGGSIRSRNGSPAAATPSPMPSPTTPATATAATTTRSSPSSTASAPSSAPKVPHHRNASSSSTASSTQAPSRSSALSPTASPPALSPPPTTTPPSSASSSTNAPSCQTIAFVTSDLAAMMESTPSAGMMRSGGLKGRLRRALTFNQQLKEEEEEEDASIKASALGSSSAAKLKPKNPHLLNTVVGKSNPGGGIPSPDVDDAESTATVQTKKKSRAASLFNSRLNASTDNISLSSTVSSASVMIRKLGSMGKLARRNSLAGITSLFKDKEKKNKEKEKEESGEESSDKKGKKKKTAKAEASEASVSHVTAELDRGNTGAADWGGAEMSGLSPAAKLARQHTLKSNAEAAAKAKAQQEAAAAAATTAAAVKPNGTSLGAGVPTWEKNTQTRQGSVSPVKGGGGFRINEDGTRVLVEEEDKSDDEHYNGSQSQGPADYNPDGWDDDEDWDGEEDEDVTIRLGMERTSMDPEYDEPEPWATDVRRSVERTRTPAKGILKYAATYDQQAYLTESVTVNRVRSNSYNAHPSQTELGPLARIPSPDPDHIDGLHRHGSHSSAHGASTSSIPTIPPLSFESPQGNSIDSPRDSTESTSTISHNPHVPERSSLMFSHSNSSAPALSTIGSSAPTLTHRSATTPSKRLAFANNLSVYDTFPPSVYDRRSEPATWSRLTPALAQRIKEELNSYKMEEMEVHAASRIHTQFFV